MDRIVAAGILAILFLIVLTGKGFAQNSPTPITDCEEISQPGDYVLTNDLPLIPSSYGEGEGGDCLIVNSPHVNIDMSGWRIFVLCPPFFCPSDLGPVGGIAIHIMNGSDHVAISNGGTQDFVYGVVGEADHTFASNLNLDAVVGVSLKNVNHGTFTNISWSGADPGHHALNGPILSVTGGGHNTIQSLSGFSEGSVPGVIVTNSSHNTIDQMTIDCAASVGLAGPGILLTQDSSDNSVTNNNIFVDFGNGIEVDLGSNHNLIQGNTVETISPLGLFAMFDENSKCAHNVWIDNTFSSFFPQDDANPASCID